MPAKAAVGLRRSDRLPGREPFLRRPGSRGRPIPVRQVRRQHSSNEGRSAWMRLASPPAAPTPGGRRQTRPHASVFDGQKGHHVRKRSHPHAMCGHSGYPDGTDLVEGLLDGLVHRPRVELGVFLPRLKNPTGAPLPRAGGSSRHAIDASSTIFAVARSGGTSERIAWAAVRPATGCVSASREQGISATTGHAEIVIRTDLGGGVVDVASGDARPQGICKVEPLAP